MKKKILLFTSQAGRYKANGPILHIEAYCNYTAHLLEKHILIMHKLMGEK